MLQKSEAPKAWCLPGGKSGAPRPLACPAPRLQGGAARVKPSSAKASFSRPDVYVQGRRVLLLARLVPHADFDLIIINVAYKPQLLHES